MSSKTDHFELAHEVLGGFGAGHRPSIYDQKGSKMRCWLWPLGLYILVGLIALRSTSMCLLRR